MKTHKPYSPDASPPAKSRLYIDTVNFPTTALAKYISVQLTPARELIPHRIRDSRDLIEKLSNKRFSQAARLVTMDIVDFYPNTPVSLGEATISACAPERLKRTCLEFSRVVHESLFI